MVFKEVEKVFNIEAVTAENYRHALTHPSYSKSKELPYDECYERLEFLGDAVLKLAVSNILYKEYPEYTEGQMSKIRSIVVSDYILAKISKDLGLSDLIIAAEHDAKQGIKQLESVAACSFEALLGAYYLDGKFFEVMEFLEEVLHPYILDVDKNFEKFNAKAILQEYTQGLTKETPVYTLIKTSGADHKRTFTIEVSYRGEVVGQGSGKTKKEAEQHAAYAACEKLGAIKHE